MSDRRHELETYFQTLGVCTIKPGFFDDPAFLAAETAAGDNGLLQLYAEYCLLAAVDQPYLDNARRIIQRLASFMSPLLVEEGRNGRCMPATLLISRFLELEGIWNFSVKGGVVVRFPVKSGLSPKEIEPLEVNVPGGTYAHYWVCAPPFAIVDLSITRQFYTPEEQQFLKRDLLEDHVSRETEQLFSGLEQLSEQFRKTFPATRVEHDGCSISYVPIQIGGPGESFVAMPEPVLRGFRGFDLYKHFKSS
jgi:hypothetical protein